MNNILKVNLPYISKKDILDKIEKYTSKPEEFFHVVSINIENLVTANKNKRFRKALQDAQIRIIDGFGVVLGGTLLGYRIGERITGVDFMQEMLDLAVRRSLTVVLIGGKPKVAEYIADCYNEKSGKKLFFGLEGIKNIKSPKKTEEERIFSIIRDTRPSFVFVSFGSPAQELWIVKNRHKLRGMVTAGVGGAFDFISGNTKRAPKIVRKLGQEWLWRLILQPWRLKRQVTRLPLFYLLVLKQKFKAF